MFFDVVFAEIAYSYDFVLSPKHDASLRHENAQGEEGQKDQLEMCTRALYYLATDQRSAGETIKHEAPERRLLESELCKIM